MSSQLLALDERPQVPSELTAFRAHVRAAIPDLLPKARTESDGPETPQVRAARHREIQGRLWNANLAGIVYPRQYGGLGLTREHQLAYLDEAVGYELPSAFAVTLGILMPTVLDYGTDEQRARYVPASLRGETMWVQLLSEPSGGSDMAGALTRAVHDGEHFVVNGSKIWSTMAHVADFGLLLARTNADVPKHRGLSTIVVPLDTEGVTINPIRLATGASDFCQEFFDDVLLPVANLVGEENDGWSVATRLLFHERSMTGNAGMNDSLLATGEAGAGPDPVVVQARRLGLAADPLVRQLVGEALTLSVMAPHVTAHLLARLTTGQIPGPGASLLKLLASEVSYRRDEIAVKVAGNAAVAWDPADEAARPGVDWLGARIITIGGGTSEMQRNQISERVLGLPRELMPDKDLPFSEVRHNAVAPRAR